MTSKVKHLAKFSPYIQRLAATCDYSRDNPNYLTGVLSEVTCKRCLHVIDRDHLSSKKEAFSVF